MWLKHGQDKDASAGARKPHIPATQHWGVYLHMPSVVVSLQAWRAMLFPQTTSSCHKISRKFFQQPWGLCFYFMGMFWTVSWSEELTPLEPATTSLTHLKPRCTSPSRAAMEEHPGGATTSEDERQSFLLACSVSLASRLFQYAVLVLWDRSIHWDIRCNYRAISIKSQTTVQ